jgi:hypothetical protein
MLLQVWLLLFCQIDFLASIALLPSASQIGSCRLQGRAPILPTTALAGLHRPPVPDYVCRRGRGCPPNRGRPPDLRSTMLSVHWISTVCRRLLCPVPAVLHPDHGCSSDRGHPPDRSVLPLDWNALIPLVSPLSWAMLGCFFGLYVHYVVCIHGCPSLPCFVVHILC